MCGSGGVCACGGGGGGGASDLCFMSHLLIPRYILFEALVCRSLSSFLFFFLF